MKRSLIAVCLAVVFTGAARASASQSTREIMTQKMDLAKELLASVVLEDFAGIRDNATELDYLAEVQSWFVLPTPEYARHSKEFRAAAEAVFEAGENENVGAASDAYGALVKKCLQCHQYMNQFDESDERR